MTRAEMLAIMRRLDARADAFAAHRRRCSSVRTTSCRTSRRFSTVPINTKLRRRAAFRFATVLANIAEGIAHG